MLNLACLGFMFNASVEIKQWLFKTLMNIAPGARLYLWRRGWMVLVSLQTHPYVCESLALLK